MEVLFLRHAHAVDGFGLQDEHRWLSERGRNEAVELGERLVARGWIPTHVRTSPKVRAAQTCELVLRNMAIKSAVEAWPALAYGTTAIALDCLEALGTGARVLLVGHEPLIRSMASHLAQQTLAVFSTATGALVSDANGESPACEMIR